MLNRFFILVIVLIALVSGDKKSQHPNVVVLLADDLGIGDLGCYGNNTINTPNIDKLASEGVRLTHHLSAASLCTPSRAALLTGRYPARYGLVGEDGTPPVIVHVSSRASLPLTEITLGRALEAANYTTAIVGKWHLGMNCALLGRDCDGPKKHGFQHFYGIPTTLVEEFRGNHRFWIIDFNQPLHQALIGSWLISVVTLLYFRQKMEFQCMTILFFGICLSFFFLISWFVSTHYRFHTLKWWKVSPWLDQFMNGLLMYDNQVIEQPLQLDGLMQNLVSFSVKFIADHAHGDGPFFLYHSFGHVHTPMFTHPSMAGKSRHGRYGDNVEEMDAGIGAIMAALTEHNLDETTIVYFLSDHGGHLECVDNEGHRVGGHNGLFKGGKGQGASEGAIRVPGIYRWKGHIPSSVSIHEPTSLLDMLPTILDLANLPQIHDLLPNLPAREIDGVSIASLLMRGEPQTARVFIHHCQRSIHAVRWAKDGHVYKMYIKKHKFPEGSHQCGWGIMNLCSCFDESVTDLTDKPLLFDLSSDPYEDDPISSATEEYKEVVTYLLDYLDRWQERVHYPPSQFRKKSDAILSLWTQPFCLDCTKRN
ncbi:arylsulfatase H-like [Macrobrachium rosenbergii]|uniref:arylsulfatase H-like n=1 Tax=Macrobrachium rosenbergii TaxID=79674 RepID=UPI0034D39568